MLREMAFTFHKSSASDSKSGDNQKMQQDSQLQLTERRFYRVLERETRAIIRAIRILIIAANAAENLHVRETAAVAQGFAHLAVKRV